VLFGSDWVAEKDFTNKIGTHCLALAAFNEQKRVVVAVDGSKLVPGKLRTERTVNRVRLSKNLYREEPLFEEVSNELVDSFLTDLGIFRSDEMSSFVATRLNYVNFVLPNSTS
jgi:translation initiation factor 2B subunit (eIF-2B alpha/beta/delta family)